MGKKKGEFEMCIRDRHTAELRKSGVKVSGRKGKGLYSDRLP